MNEFENELEQIKSMGIKNSTLDGFQKWYDQKEGLFVTSKLQEVSH